MTTQTLHRSLMPWDGIPSNERILRILIIIGLILVLLLYFIIPLVELPEEEVEEIPERFAQLIIEEEPIVEEPPPPPIEEEKPEEETPEEIIEEEVVEEEVIEEPEPEVPEVVEKPEQTVEEAKEVAETAGLNAFKDSLAAMRQSLNLQNTSAPLITADNTQRKAYKGSDLNTDLTAGSGGIDTAKYQQSTGAASSLGGRKGKKVTGKVKASGTGKARKPKKRADGKRSSEQINLALQQLQGPLDRIYNKARRSDPTLEGVVTFQVTVEASGKVSAIKVVNSQLGDPALESKLASRIKLLGNFGPGPKETFSFGITFTP